MKRGYVSALSAVLMLGAAVPAGAGPDTAPSSAAPAAAHGAAAHGATETTICDLIATAAQDQSLPVAFLTRLIWQESSFRPGVVSPAGAQGIAQFMPRTAGERGLADPFDPQAAIPKAAELLADLGRRFGNLGLAAAAYNAGPARVANWLAGHGSLPYETRSYVLAITAHPVEDWIGGAQAKAESTVMPDVTKKSRAACLAVTADIRLQHPTTFATSAFIAPWGVQLAGSFNKSAALASFERTRVQYAAILGSGAPMILTTPSLGRGMRPYYRVRMPATTRGDANRLCSRIEHAGGACAVLRN
jgi:hypothetical protein